MADAFESSIQEGPSPTVPELHITVRFTNSEPDLRLEVSRPDLMSVVALTQLIRSKLPNPSNKSRLRLIYGGAVLSEKSLLASVLKLPPPPQTGPKGKGKSKALETEYVFINCSIGHVLSDGELLEEKEKAAHTASSIALSADLSSEDGSHRQQAQQSKTSTTPAPQGFDRLLNSGFTAAEVNQLRMQFLSIRAAGYTPDTMPSPSVWRHMEDAWMDENNAGGGGASTEQDADAASDALDDLLWGMSIGFLWPLGAMVWLSREQGVWSHRRQTAVWSGFVLCLAFGIMNMLS